MLFQRYCVKIRFEWFPYQIFNRLISSFSHASVKASVLSANLSESAWLFVFCLSEVGVLKTFYGAWEQN